MIARIKARDKSETIPIRVLIDEMIINGFINTPEQLIFSRAQFFSYENSLDKVPYVQALEDINNLVVNFNVTEKSIITEKNNSEYGVEELEENREMIYSNLEPDTSEEEKNHEVESSRTTQETHKTYTTDDSGSSVIEESNIIQSINIEEGIEELIEP